MLRKALFTLLVIAAGAAAGFIAAQTPTRFAAIRVDGTSDLRGAVANSTGNLLLSDGTIEVGTIASPPTIRTPNGSNSSGVNLAILAGNGVGTNQAGGNITITAGAPTGTGASGGNPGDINLIGNGAATFQIANVRIAPGGNVELNFDSAGDFTFSDNTNRDSGLFVNQQNAGTIALAEVMLVNNMGTALALQHTSSGFSGELLSGSGASGAQAGLYTDAAEPLGLGTNGAAGITIDGSTQKASVIVGVTSSGGLKHQRVTTGSIGAAGTATVTLTWTAAFADTNYTPVCSVISPTVAATGLVMVTVGAKTAAKVDAFVSNTSAGALTGQLDCIAMHD